LRYDIYYYYIAKNYYYLEQYEKSLDVVEEALKIYPLRADAWYGKGLSLDNLGRCEEAIACYDEIIEKLDPAYVDAWNNKGVSLGKQGKDEEAIACFDEIIKKLDPTYVRLGDYSSTIIFSYKGHMLDDTWVTSRIGLGMEGPNDTANPFTKIGFEGYGDNKAGSCYGFVIADGISRSTIGTAIPIKEIKPKFYAFTVDPDNCCRVISTDGLILSTTSNIPSRGHINHGMTFGIKTHDQIEKKFSLVSANWSCL
jgi:tetratricopeptide (TPR) repeat protein